MFKDSSDFYAMPTVLYNDWWYPQWRHQIWGIVDAAEESCVDANEKLRVKADSKSAHHFSSPIAGMLRLVKKTAQLSTHIKWLFPLTARRFPMTATGLPSDQRNDAENWWWALLESLEIQSHQKVHISGSYWGSQEGWLQWAVSKPSQC